MRLLALALAEGLCSSPPLRRMWEQGRGAPVRRGRKDVRPAQQPLHSSRALVLRQATAMQRRGGGLGGLVLGVLQALQAPQPQRRESTRIPVSGRQQALVRVLRRRALLIRRHQASVARPRASASPLQSCMEGRDTDSLTQRRVRAPLQRLAVAVALFVLAPRLRALRLRLVEHLG